MRRMVFGMQMRVELTLHDKIKVEIMNYLRSLKGGAATNPAIHRRIIMVGLLPQRSQMKSTARVVSVLVREGFVRKVRVVSSDGKVAFRVPKPKNVLPPKHPDEV